MKSKLTALIGGMLVIWVVAWQVRSGKLGSMEGPAEGFLELAEVDGDGNSVLRDAILANRQSPPLEAMIRHEVDLYGVTVHAPGRYLHQGQGGGGVRIELKATVDQQIASLLRVSDGRFLYSRTQLGETTRLTRLDLERIRRELGKEGAAASLNGGITDPESGPLAAASDWMIGGLPYLLSRLEEEFAFSSPQPDLLGEIPVWKIDGVWKRARLRRVVALAGGGDLGSGPVVPSVVPPQLPTSVRLTLGRGGQLPLFPYQLHFVRTERQRGQSSERIIASLEFLHVRVNGPIDASEFQYLPQDEEIIYLTDDFLASIARRVDD